jgi:hypothetical protein
MTVWALHWTIKKEVSVPHCLYDSVICPLNHKHDSVSSAFSNLIDESSALEHYSDSANNGSYHQYNNVSIALDY